jgi:hypothetical protein
MVVDGARNADAAGLSERLQPRRDVDPISEYVVLLANYVAKVDADAKPDAPVLGDLWLAIDHPPLDLDGAANRIDDARKLSQQAVPGVLDHPAPVFLDLRIDQFGEMRFELFVRALFIRPHQARISRHISGKAAGCGHRGTPPRVGRIGDGLTMYHNLRPWGLPEGSA